MGKVLEKIKVIDFAAEGKCFARMDEKILFIKKTAPGDVVDVLLTNKRKGFLEGRAITFHEKSNLRIEPFCVHYDLCGGCQWQHVPYETQLSFKQTQVKDQLQRIGKLAEPRVETILACKEQREYRNKMEYSFAEKRWLLPSEVRDPNIEKTPGLGFHMSGHFDKVLDIQMCHLQENLSNEIRNWMRDYAISHEIPFFNLKEKRGVLRSLTIRNTRKCNWMIVIQFGIQINDQLSSMLDQMIKSFPQISSVFYVINQKMNDTFLDLDTVHYFGEHFINETIEDLEFRIRPKSFFQTNPYQAEVLYQKAREFCGDLQGKTVYDLYTGTGTIALFLAKTASKVIGIESVDQAIEDAKWNAQHNGIPNAEFFCGDMRDLLTKDFCDKNGRPDVIVTDPPRDGMHKNVIDVLLELEAPRIVYVSCKPSTQARDLAILSEKYSVDKIQPVDMFPHTHHVENIVQLNLK